MASNDYMSDMDCFKSFSHLREKLFYDHKLLSKNNVNINTYTQATKVKKTTASLSELKNDKSVIIAIQNDVRFINIIMNCRKQRSPIAYIFVESGLYVSCVVKNANGYPLVFIRIPIDDVYAYACNTNNTYEFPIQGLLNKDIKYNNNNSYTIMFKYDGQDVNFVYELYNGDLEPNRIIINSINTNNQAIINGIFKNDTNGIIPSVLNPFTNYTNAVYNDNENYLLAFYNMNVIILREIQDITTIIQFNQKQSAKTMNYFEIKNNQMNYISETSKNHNDKYICSSKDSIIWAIMDEDVKRYDIVPFESLFKINYKKSITTNDRVYYAFTSYLGNYMFIKIITPLIVDTNQPIKSFTKIFSKDYQILECYACIKHND